MTDEAPKKQRKPLYRPTIRESRGIMMAVIDMLAFGYRKSEIKRTVKSKWNISTHTVERYIARAREEMLEAMEKTQMEHIAESIEFWQKIARNLKAPLAERRKARENIERLMGIRAPTQIIMQRAEQEVTEEEERLRRERLADKIARFQAEGVLRNSLNPKDN